MAGKKFWETVSEWSLQGGLPTGPLAGAFYADTWQLSQNNFFHLQIILGFGIYMIYNFATKKGQEIPTESATKKSNHWATHNILCNDSATLKFAEFANLIKIKNASAGNEKNYQWICLIGTYPLCDPKKVDFVAYSRNQIQREL